jgi:hypothetical protein
MKTANNSSLDKMLLVVAGILVIAVIVVATLPMPAPPTLPAPRAQNAPVYLPPSLNSGTIASAFVLSGMTTATVNIQGG